MSVFSICIVTLLYCLTTDCHDYSPCVCHTTAICHYIVQHEKTRRQLEDKLSYNEGIIMSLQKENIKFQEDIARLKNERNRLQNKVIVSSNWTAVDY